MSRKQRRQAFRENARNATYQRNMEAEEMKGRNNTPSTYKAKVSDNKDTRPLEPLNQRQAEYIYAIENYPVVICTGVWGSAKTYIPAVMAADMMLSKEINKIVIARPTEGKAKSVGFFKGTKDEKLEGWAAPVLDTLKKRLGPAFVEYLLEHGRIELLALEQVKGRSWDDTFILVDEAEDLEPATAKSLVGRQGINSKIVITGDINQKDLQSYSGLEMLLEVAKYGDIDMEVIDFDDWEYCVRSDESKAWGKAFELYEKDNGVKI